MKENNFKKKEDSKIIMIDKKENISKKKGG